MVATAQGYGELIGDFPGHGARLHETQVVGVNRRASANEARLRAHMGKMSRAAPTSHLWNQERAMARLR